MPKKTKRTPPPLDVNRRKVLTAGLAASAVGSAGLASSSASQSDTPNEIEWHYEADVVVLGSGGVGLTAAVRAVDLGASVLVLEQSFDVGGKLSQSGGWTSLGGGDAIQESDRTGTDPQGIGLVAPLVPPEDLDDDADTLFRDLTDWTVVNDAAIPEYRYNDPELHRGLADNAAAVRQFLMNNHVRFSRITGTHFGGGMSKARGPWAIMKLADVTDIEAGTVSLKDKGDELEERSSQFCPMFPPGPSAAGISAPGWVFGGFAIARSLEYSARQKGVQFMVNRHMDSIIRDSPQSGRVLGVSARYTPRVHPETGERLESYWSDGNIDETADVINVRARKAVIVGTGGHMGNPQFRTMFDPRTSEPSIQYGGALMGEGHEDASGIIAGMQVGASLAGLMQPYGYGLATPRLNNRIGTLVVTDATYPGHPAFLFSGSIGVSIGPSGWDHVIAVNQVGKRFYNESSIDSDTDGYAAYPPGSAGTKAPFRPLDWRNSSVEHVRSTYALGGAHDAALAMNEGSQAPDYNAGPVWAIFDQAAADRNGWELRYPYIADPPNGSFFKANSIGELSRMVEGNAHQNMPLFYLEDTVERYNAAAEAGVDEAFEKPVMHRIATGPFYAAVIPMAVYDSYGGLRINSRAQVKDMMGEVIPGLYAGGEASGGGRQHGIGRATVTGYIAGTNAAQEPT